MVGPWRVAPSRAAGEFADRLRSCGGVGDDLGEHRVVVDGDRVTALVAGVQADGRGQGQAVQGARLGGPVPCGVLGVEAGLHRVATRAWGFVVQRGPFRDPDLFRHQVEAEHGLGDRVFDLEAGVHLQEVRPAVGDQELDRARTHVVHRAGGTDRQVVQLSGEFVGQAGGRGLLDHLLVAALEGAVAGAQGPDRAVGVGEDLDLHMAAVLDVRFDEDLAVAEGARGLGAGAAQGRVQVLEAAYDPHAAAAAARGRLHQHGQVGGRDVRERGDAHQLLRARLGRHRLDRGRGRADPHQARVQDRPREVGVLGEEAVAGVDGVGAGGDRRLHDQVGAQVGVGGGRARESYGRVGHARVEGVRVRVGVHGDRSDAQFTARAEDPAGDLAPVGDEHRSDHWRFLTSGRRRSRHGRPRRGRCGSRTGTCRGPCGCRGGR